MAIAPQEHVNEARRIAAIIEPCAIVSWPARETLQQGGWILRFTNGYSHRGNAVAVMADDGGDLAVQIANAEHAYAERGLAPQFQVTPLTIAGLEDALAARGYRAEALTKVCVADVDIVCAPQTNIGRVDCLEKTNAAFDALVVSGSPSTGDGDERLEILNRLAHPHIRALAFDGDTPVACGIATNVKGCVGISVMRTNAAYRRQGHASHVLAALARWAKAQSATQLYLQVDEQNAPARALYARTGFRDAYGYCYYVRNQTGT